MMDRPSSWVPLDVNFQDDPKIQSVGPLAQLLYVRSLAWAKRLRTGGRIDEVALSRCAEGLGDVGPLVAQLTRAKLWTKHRKMGHFIHSWEQWNGEDGFRRRSRHANHVRWHVNRNLDDPSCPLCRSYEDPPRNPKGVPKESQKEKSKYIRSRIGGLRPQPLSPTMFDRPPEWVPETREEGLR